MHIANIPPVLGLAPLFRTRLPKHKVLEISHVWCHQGHVPPTPSDCLLAAFSLSPGSNSRKIQSKVAFVHTTKQNAKCTSSWSNSSEWKWQQPIQWTDSAYHEGIIGNAGAGHRLPKGRHGRFVLTVDWECRAWGVTMQRTISKRMTALCMKWSVITKQTWAGNIHMQYRAGSKGWRQSNRQKINSMTWVKAEEFLEATPKTTKQAHWSPFHSQLSKCALSATNSVSAVQKLPLLCHTSKQTLRYYK